MGYIFRVVFIELARRASATKQRKNKIPYCTSIYAMTSLSDGIKKKKNTPKMTQNFGLRRCLYSFKEKYHMTVIIQDHHVVVHLLAFHLAHSVEPSF